MKSVIAIFLICLGLVLHTTHRVFCQPAESKLPISPSQVKILILGNSITQHNPAPELGWTGHWGMAASEESKDYVHLIIDSLKHAGINADIQFANVALSFEQRFWNYDSLKVNTLADSQPDILILRLGDNINEDELKQHALQNDIEKLASRLFPNKEQHVIITSAFWDKPAVNSHLKKCAEAHKWEYVELSDLSKASQNMALGQFANPGVAKHPSDKGMREIAQRILKPLLLMTHTGASEKQ